MKLEEIYKEVENRIQHIDFDALWENFHPYDFALYSDETVCFQGVFFPRTDEFVANTSIYYENQWIAIWHLRDEDTDFDILTAKIIHEMFHAFQMEMGEKRFANEVEAVRKYRYIPEEMELRYRESELLAELVDSFCIDTWNRMLAYRKYRKTFYPYEYQYMMQIESIEGAAQHVEMEVIRQLNTDKYKTYKSKLIQRLTTIDNLIPIRTICYDSGALLLTLCKDNSIPLDYSIGISTAAFWEKFLNGDESIRELMVREEINRLYEMDQKNVKQMLIDIMATADEEYTGNYQLIGFDPYGARNYTTCIYTHFLKVKDEREYMWCGNIVFSIDENNHISEIYVKNEGE